MTLQIYDAGEGEARQPGTAGGGSAQAGEPVGAGRCRPPLSAALALYTVILMTLILLIPAMRGYSVNTTILVSEWLFIMIPCLAFIRALRIEPQRDLRIAPISAATAVGTVLASVSAILLTGEIVVLQNEIVPIPPEYLKMMQQLFTLSGDVPWPLSLFVFAVSPAVCEELLFRGILLRGALGRVSPFWAVFISGALFGLFHLDPYRFIGTMVLGLIMGFIALRASSLLASMIYHATNNLVILLVMNLAPFNDVPWLVEEAHVPSWILLPCAVVFVGALSLVRSDRVRGEGPPMPPHTA